MFCNLFELKLELEFEFVYNRNKFPFACFLFPPRISTFSTRKSLEVSLEVEQTFQHFELLLQLPEEVATFVSQPDLCSTMNLFQQSSISPAIFHSILFHLRH